MAMLLSITKEPSPADPLRAPDCGGSGAERPPERGRLRGAILDTRVKTTRTTAAPAAGTSAVTRPQWDRARPSGTKTAAARTSRHGAVAPAASRQGTPRASRVGPPLVFRARSPPRRLRHRRSARMTGREKALSRSVRDRAFMERRAGLAPAFPRRKRGVFPWTTNAAPPGVLLRPAQDQYYQTITPVAASKTLTDTLRSSGPERTDP